MNKFFYQLDKHFKIKIKFTSLWNILIRVIFISISKRNKFFLIRLLLRILLLKLFMVYKYFINMALYIDNLNPRIYLSLRMDISKWLIMDLVKCSLRIRLLLILLSGHFSIWHLKPSRANMVKKSIYGPLEY